MAEQYELDGRSRERSIQVALAQYRPVDLFIRDVGSRGGATRAYCVIGKRDKLAMTPVHGGYSIRVNGREVFFFAVTRSYDCRYWWGKHWALEYRRMYPKSPECPYGRMHIVARPYENPDDPTLPEITESALRSVNYGHLLEVRFKGKVSVKRVRPDKTQPGWSYWSIIPPS
ncbi:MAG: hypothetical protein HYT82_02240 [Candidatus Harrisonbacteria bacterium]|nr:hypothetical protein [Candidatus Harrisonbacteria bacterium]MBI2406042.1 hypothetical protein [Candidatus Harrisonbacteria bacterium]MBI2604158.1 hypothetical protein [Candidatus Harrisonbacteria bacterium]